MFSLCGAFGVGRKGGDQRPVAWGWVIGVTKSVYLAHDELADGIVMAPVLAFLRHSLVPSGRNVWVLPFPAVPCRSSRPILEKRLAPEADDG